MNGLELVARSIAGPMRASGNDGMSLDEWSQMFTFGSPLFSLTTSMKPDREDIQAGFAGMVTGAYMRNGIVFACLMARAQLFSEARFQFQQLFGGRTGALFGTPDLSPLEHPEPGETTGDMLFRASLDSDLAGDWFGVRRVLKGGVQIKRIRPDWTTVVLGSRNPDIEPEAIGYDVDTEVVGYGYQPGGWAAGSAPVAFGPAEVAHFYPNRDPLARYRGLPIVVSVIREMLGDSAATNHKLAFFRNSATSNIAIELPSGWNENKARQWIETFEGKHTGSLNAYRTLYFGGGMKANVIGQNFQQMTFKELQGSFETRVAAVTGMHSVIVGLSEGLAGSSLNAGNFAAAARLVGDKTLRPLWRNMSGSLESIIATPGGTRLWYSEKDIAFLRADVKDVAEVLQANAMTITALVKEGFTPASSVDAVTAGDMNRLVHSGLLSVQLQPPGSTFPGMGSPAAPPAAYRANGDFWAVDFPFSEIGPIRAGAIVDASHPIVRAFPSMFSPTDPKLLGSGPVPIVTRAEVVARRAELQAGGHEAGYDTLARELGVSRDTVRRRLNERND